MPSSLYPDGTIQHLLQTDAVSAATKAAIEPRLALNNASPQYFDANSFRLLTIVCQHLLALTDPDLAASIAKDIDTRLAAGTSDGWRYHHMPDDRNTFTSALQGINQTAETAYHEAFETLPADKQVAVLRLIQDGKATGDAWSNLPSNIFFEELLNEATELFYSYPYAQNEIGYVGMADMHGWTKIGINEQDEIEPSEQHIDTRPPSQL